MTGCARRSPERGWELDDQHVYRDDGYSGASLGRPGLDRLRDHAALADLDVVLVTAPDRLARNYVHQVLLIDELAGHGCRVEFLDRPMSEDPHDQLLLQIRGAVAEYERTLIAERMRRGRQARLRAGTLLPWTRAAVRLPAGPDRPRDAAAVRVEPGEAVLVAQLFDWYLEPRATLYQLAARLAGLGVATPTGKPRWTVASVRGILRNPAYTGRALTNRTRACAGPPPQVGAAAGRAGREPCPAAGTGLDRGPGPADRERGDLRPGAGQAGYQPAKRGAQHPPRVPAARAGQLRHVPAGVHRPPDPAPATATTCAAGAPTRCARRRGGAAPPATSPPGSWTSWSGRDLCALLTDPAQVARALARARGGAWLPQELQARQAAIRQALGQLERQQQRLLDAYLAEVIGLAELERKRQDLDRRHATLTAQQRQLDAAAGQRLELRAVADGIEAFCQAIRAGLATATFDQRRQLAELLIDRVIVTDSQVEIRYVLPTSPDGPHRPFCQLRKDHLDPVADAVDPGDLGQAGCRVRAARLRADRRAGAGW